MTIMLVLAPVPQAPGQTPVPDFSKTFNPDTIGVGNTTTLTFEIDNSSSSDPADDMAFTDTMPSEVEVAPVPGVDNDCGGTVTAVAGSSTVSLSGGKVGAGETCTISVGSVEPLAHWKEKWSG